MEFRNRSTPCDSRPSPAGQVMRAEYERRIDDKGISRLVKVGEFNFYAHKQSFAADCQIYTLLDRYRQTGDTSYIDQQKGRYLDVTNTPRTLAELEQFRIDSERAFYDLPVDIRKLFHNNPNLFISDPARAQNILDHLSKGGKVVHGEASTSQSAAAAGTPAAEGS